MKYVWLVALREYAENAKTKGFWFGLLLFPVMMVASMWVTENLDKATPTRQFVLVDQSGEFEEIAQKGMDRLHQRDVFKAFGKWVSENAKGEEGSPGGAPTADMLEATSVDVEKLLAQFTETNSDAFEDFMDQGGLKAALAATRPFLKEGAPEFEEPRPRFRRVPLPPDVDRDADLATLAEQLRPYLRGDRKIDVDGEKKELFSALLIPRNVLDHVQRPGQVPDLSAFGGESSEVRGVQYWAANLADKDLRNEIRNVINREVRRREYVDRGVDAEEVRAVQNTYINVTDLNPKKAVGKEKVSIADTIRQWAPVGFVYLLWISIFTISQMLLNNTIEEKSNRIIEVLLSSVTSGELMMGKLFGIAGIGLTMVVSWIISLVVILAVKAEGAAKWAVALYEVLQESNLLVAFAVYFILGYFLYAGIFLSIGSLCSSLKEAQNLMGVIMMVMIVPLLTMMFIPKDPNGTLATIMSWIPLYTPFTMMNRAAADPPLFDIIGTGILLTVFMLLVLWLSGRIFRVAILRTGQLPKFVEVLRWMRGA